MLTAAVCGDVFSSPSVAAITAVSSSFLFWISAAK